MDTPDLFCGYCNDMSARVASQQVVWVLKEIVHKKIWSQGLSRQDLKKCRTSDLKGRRRAFPKKGSTPPGRASAGVAQQCPVSPPEESRPPNGLDMRIHQAPPFT